MSESVADSGREIQWPLQILSTGVDPLGWSYCVVDATGAVLVSFGSRLSDNRVEAKRWMDDYTLRHGPDWTADDHDRLHYRGVYITTFAPWAAEVAAHLNTVGFKPNNALNEVE